MINLRTHGLLIQCINYQTLGETHENIIHFASTVKPVLSSHSKKTKKLVFKTEYCLMLVKSIAECSKGSILQYFRPSLGYHLPLRQLFCLFLSGRLRQVLLYFVADCSFKFCCLFQKPNKALHGPCHEKPGTKLIKLFSCSTQMSMKFQLLIKSKMLNNTDISCFKSHRCCIYRANKC